MKKTIFFLAAVMMLASCSFTKNAGSSTATTTPTTTTPATGTAAGQGAGNALHSLYTQYKADGTFNYKNTQNILNTVSLLANCGDLATNYKDKSYLAEFGKGLIAGSFGLVTKDNVSSVTNSLVEMVKNSETGQKVSSTTSSAASTMSNYAGTAAQYAGAISSLLGSFSGK